jgi:uncharacterized protein (DUF736 family)
MVRIQGLNLGSGFRVNIQDQDSGLDSGPDFRVKIQGKDLGSGLRVKIQGWI